MIARSIELPQALADQLAKLPESGMDYQLVDVLLADYRVFQTIVLGHKLLVSEEPMTPEDVIQVLCVRGRDGTIYHNPTI